MATNKPHTLADHLHGVDHDHEHDVDHDHEHDVPIEENALWLQDNISLASVGIDIGSAGTQVIFSRLHMRRLGEELSSRYFVIKRETLYQSPVALTPYASETRIDEEAVSRIIDEAYAGAGLHPDAIDTGSVILTGEALRRENARAIGELLAEIGGEFVCAAAGHHMEAMLAAYGSGAAKVSHDHDWRVLNIDIGGGTTKLALIDDGRVLETAAIHIGGRLLVADADGRITRLDPAGRALAQRAGFDWHVGDKISSNDLDSLCEWMAESLCMAILGERR
ncbi:MAG: ethanolamine ammonia-lyase reactivating factor EutA, partial [Dongiaceae bacterium]